MRFSLVSLVSLVSIVSIIRRETYHHGHKLILEVRREQSIDEEAISVLRALRATRSHIRSFAALQFLFFLFSFLYSIFCLEFGCRATCQWCRDIGQSGPQGGQPSRVVGMCVR